MLEAATSQAEYDLFVLHAEPDTGFVRNYLLQSLGLEETSPRVILPSKYELGRPTLAEVERADAWISYVEGLAFADRVGALSTSQFDPADGVGEDASVSDASKPFVETVRIRNFGCVRDVTLELTRLHALIGPNDSGKSTALAALRTACQLIRFGEDRLEDTLDRRGVVGSEIAMGWGETGITCTRTQYKWTAGAGFRNPPSTSPISAPLPMSDLTAAVYGARLVRWDPDAIRRPCTLIPEGNRLVIGERGEGLAAIYDAILSRDRQVFDKIEAGVRQHFPTVKAIWLPALDQSMKALGITLSDGAKVHADEMSEGLLYWLAFAVLPYADTSAILLIEEPENGLHPSRIAEVVTVLREVSQRAQVLLATHSPLVINELQPDEVTILTRNDKTGTRATRLDRTQHFQQRQKVYALGELWLSYADGVDEAALVDDSDSKPAE